MRNRLGFHSRSDLNLRLGGENWKMRTHNIKIGYNFSKIRAVCPLIREYHLSLSFQFYSLPHFTKYDSTLQTMLGYKFQHHFASKIAKYFVTFVSRPCPMKI